MPGFSFATTQSIVKLNDFVSINITLNWNNISVAGVQRDSEISAQANVNSADARRNRFRNCRPRTFDVAVPGSRRKKQPERSRSQSYVAF